MPLASSSLSPIANMVYCEQFRSQRSITEICLNLPAPQELI
jgi:hypothetical protein